MLELIEWEGGKGASAEGASVKGAHPRVPTSTHVALRVSDIDAAHRALVEAGLTVFSAPVELEEENHWLGTRVFYARDPDGTMIELVQGPPRDD